MKTKVSRILLIIFVIIPFATLLVLSYFNSWITPFYQSDLSGSLYAMFEKKILHKVVHFYSPTYNEPGYAKGYLGLNDIFLTILPSFPLLYSNNILVSLSILKIVILLVAFASMYVSIYYLTRGNALLSVILGLLYSFSPVFMIYYFVPILMFSYAVLPLVITPLIDSMISGKLNRVRLVLVFGILLGLHPHILIFTVSLVLVIYIADLLLAYLKREQLREKIKVIMTIIPMLIIVLTIRYYATYLIGSPGRIPIDVLLYERLTHYGEFHAFSLSNFVELLGGFNKGGFVAYSWYAKFSAISYMKHCVYAYVALIAVIVWLLIITGLWSRKPYVKKISLITLLVAVTAWSIHEILLWLHQNPWLSGMLSNIPLLGKAITISIYTLRTPWRISGVVLAFAILALGIVLSSLSKKRKLYVKINTFLGLLVTSLIILNMLYFNFSTVFVHYTLSERPGWREWPPYIYNNVRMGLKNIYGYFNATVIDHSVSEPRLMHIGQVLYNDFNHYSYFVNSPSLTEMTRDLAPVIWITSIDSVKETESLFYRGIGAFQYNYSKGLSVFLLDKPAVRLWMRIPKNLCEVLQKPRSLLIRINITNVVSFTTIKSKQLLKVLKELRDINGSTSFALETWVKITDYAKNRNQIILSTGDLWTNGSLALFYGWGSDLYFSLGKRNTATLRAIIPRWHLINHVVAVFDKGTMYIYVNGKLFAKKFINKEKVYLHFNSNNIKYNEMPYGIALETNIFKIKGGLEPLRFAYQVIDSKISNDMLIGNVKLKIESNYCRDVWIPLNIPLYSTDLSGLKISLEDLSGKFLHASINLENSNISFRTYIFVENVYNGLNECKEYKPVIVQGGANTISSALDLLDNLMRKEAVCIFPVSTISALKSSKHNIISVINIASLYYDFLKNNNRSFISFYKCYMPSSGLRIRGFGLRYYWSRPFLGYIPSGIYGEYNDAPYSLIIDRTRPSAVLELNVINMNNVKTDKYYVFVDMTVQGRGNISITLLDKENKIILSKSIHIGTYIPLHLFVNVGEINIIKNKEKIFFEINKNKGMIVALNNLFFSKSKLYQLVSRYSFTFSSPVYIIPLVPFVQLVNISANRIYINNVYWYKYASLLMDDAGGLHIISGGSITLLPIKLANITYDIYIHLVPPVPSGSVIRLNVTINSDVKVSNYSIIKSVIEDRWVKIGSIKLRTSSAVTLNVKVLKGYVNIDAIALVPSKIMNIFKNESNYILIKKYYIYLRHDIKKYALETLNGYTLLPANYSKIYGNTQSVWTLIDKKWFFISLIFTIKNIFTDLSVILLIVLFIVRCRSRNTLIR